MQNQTNKFLEFNGKNIYFLSVNGTYWIAVKPICEALEVDYIQQFKNLKTDPILGHVLCNHTMRDSLGRAANMVSLPEKFIYGWIFGIQSSSTELINFKWQCYEILFDYFHGSVVQRPSILKEKAKLQIQIENLQRKVVSSDDYQKLQELKNLKHKVQNSLYHMDRQIMSSQIEIWKQEFMEDTPAIEKANS